jgi:hypothetical protein
MPEKSGWGAPPAAADAGDASAVNAAAIHKIRLSFMTASQDIGTAMLHPPCGSPEGILPFVMAGPAALCAASALSTCKEDYVTVAKYACKPEKTE